MVKRWLITGGCGFIGRNLISSLLNEKDNFIRIIDNLKVGSKEDLRLLCNFSETDPNNVSAPPKNKRGVELIVEDILNADLALTACKGIDVIVHLAANTGVAPSVENPRLDCETNVFGTLNYLEAARTNKVSRFVFASSGAPVGEVEPPIHEDLAPHPVSPYGASKLAGEGYCSAFYRTFGIETVCLRFGNVYGPLSNKKDSVVAKFIKNAIDGQPLVIFGDGSQTRDFIYVDDLVQAIKQSSSISGIGGEIFQIATNRETTVSELVNKLIPLLSNHGIDNVQIIHGESRLGDVKRNYSDTFKANNILNWSCQYNLKDGLDMTIKSILISDVK